jgi:hypothetical protein
LQQHLYFEQEQQEQEREQKRQQEQRKRAEDEDEDEDEDGEKSSDRVSIVERASDLYLDAAAAATAAVAAVPSPYAGTEAVLLALHLDDDDAALLKQTETPLQASLLDASGEFYSPPTSPQGKQRGSGSGKKGSGKYGKGTKKGRDGGADVGSGEEVDEEMRYSPGVSMRSGEAEDVKEEEGIEEEGIEEQEGLDLGRSEHQGMRTQQPQHPQQPQQPRRSEGAAGVGNAGVGNAGVGNAGVGNAGVGNGPPTELVQPQQQQEQQPQQEQQWESQEQEQQQEQQWESQERGRAGEVGSSMASVDGSLGGSGQLPNGQVPSLGQLGKAVFRTSISPTPIQWRMGDLLGEGTFGKVYMGLNQITGELFAIKKIDLARECGAVNLAELDGDSTVPTDGTAARPWDHNAKQVKKLEQEIDLMKQLEHKHIVRYLGTSRAYRPGTHMCEHLFIFLEYVPGGSVASMLSQVRKCREHAISGEEVSRACYLR